MGASLRVQVRLHDAHDIECLSVLFVEHVGLVEAGLEVPLHRGLLKVWHWKMAIIHLAAILTPKAVPSLGPSVREVQCGLTSECGNEGQVGLLRSMQGVVVAKVALQDEWSERDHPRDPLEEGVKHGCDPHELRREGDGWLGCMPTALRTLEHRLALAALAWLATFSASLRTTCSTWIGNERCAYTLTKARAKKAKPGTGLPYRLEKTIQAMSGLADFGDHYCIASQHVDLLGTVERRMKEHPKERRPREHGGEKALHGAIAPPWPAQRDRPSIVIPLVMTKRASIIRFHWRKVVTVIWVGGIGKVLQTSIMGFCVGC